MTKRQTTNKVADANATLAYKFWKARCFCEGSPEEELFRAVCANSMKLDGTKLRSNTIHRRR
jgi:hypothetical protein